jgi:ATP-binding cassette subfamily F protein 3
LDFISENILIQALQQYAGSFIVVSHNRFFVSQIANKIWYIEDKQIKEYPGTYDEYEYWRKKNEASGLKAEPVKATKTEKKIEKNASPNQPSSDVRLKSLERDLRKIEDQISALELHKSELEKEMTKPEVFQHFERLQPVQTNFKKMEADLNIAERKWEEIVNAIEQLNSGK